MIYLKKPDIFSPKFDVAACFIEHEGRVLLLHRQNHKPQGNTWCIPGGKIEKGEIKAEAVLREVKEETGFEMDPSRLKFLKTVFIKYDEYDFIYEIYQFYVEVKPTIIIDVKDHKDFVWVTPAEALKMNLIPDEDACIKLCYF